MMASKHFVIIALMITALSSFLGTCLAAHSDSSNELDGADGTVVTRLGEQLSSAELKTLRHMSNEAPTLRERRSDDGGPLEAVVAQQAQELTALKAQLEAMKIEVQAAKTDLHQRGSTFIRWGRTDCTAHSQLVYSGLAGGSYYGHSGAAVNRLCLTKNPQFDNTSLPVVHGLLYGSEYNKVPGYHDQDVPCALCRAPQSTTIMMAATLTCPAGWTEQYTGHLASQYYGNAAGIEYVCLDGHPQVRPSGQANQNGNLFTYTVTRCGSLPCPPYGESKIVTCVICSV